MDETPAIPTNDHNDPEGLVKRLGAEGKVGLHDFMARVASVLTMGDTIARKLGELGDYDRQEAEEFVANIENQVTAWAENLLTRKERNLAELRKIIGGLRSPVDNHDERKTKP